MIKYTQDHPAFQRTRAFIEAQVLKCRPSAIKMAMAIELPLVGDRDEATIMRHVADRVANMEVRMTKRLCQYYGLKGKYVAH